MNAIKELQRLDKRLAETEREVREAEQGQRDAHAQLEAVKQRWTEHFASEDHDPLPVDLHNAQHEAEREAAKPWAEMLAGKATAGHEAPRRARTARGREPRCPRRFS
jgi:hypothetical protein